VTVASLIVAVATLAVGLALAVGVRRLPTLWLQLVALVVMAAALPLAAVLVSGAAMFESGRDVVALVALVAASTGALAGALLVGRSIAARIGRIRDASRALAGGDLAARTVADGPAELVELGRSFNEMAARLGELFDARAQLVVWASHDLRTPLASMQAMIEAMEDGVLDVERSLPALREQVQALGGLVDDLFELSRLDSGSPLELHVMSLPGLVGPCLRGFQAEAEARRVRLEARIAEPTPAVLCAPGKTERVLHNLVSNALRHTPAEGSVTVLVEPDADGVRVVVEDTGEGIPTGAVERAFDRDWLAERARGRSGGGLGLVIARGLIEAQGGRIWAERRPGGGSRVCFTLHTT
jgi:signal transduction histidine kinase